MGALRKRLDAVRPENGKVMGEERVVGGVLGAEMRRWPFDEMIWVVLAGWEAAGVVDLSYSMVGVEERFGMEGLRCGVVVEFSVLISYDCL
jgi:hypothetical protein